MRSLRRSVLAVALAASMGCLGPVVSPPPQPSPALHTVSNSPPPAASVDAGLLLGLVIVGVYLYLLVAGRGN